MNKIFAIKSTSKQNSSENLVGLVNSSKNSNTASTATTTTTIANNSSTVATTVDQLPKYGVKTNKLDELDKIMSELNIWGIDVFLIDQLTMNRPLTAVGYTVFQVGVLFLSDFDLNFAK